MSDQRVGAAFRAVRLRRGLRQADVALAADVAEGLVSSFERGRFGTATISAVRRVAALLEIEIDLWARWQGGELDRLINVRHNLLAEAVTRYLSDLGWVVEPEVSFSYYGERGVIDLFAWHPATATILIVEIKTDIVDAQELLGTLDRKTRLARRIARDRGLKPTTVATWLVVADGSTNRKRVARFSSLLRAALPADTRQMSNWLSRPSGTISGISFFSNLNKDGLKQCYSGRQRVRVKKVAADGAEPSVGSTDSDAVEGVTTA
jgi:transcriptional regulator with XRE-family HTH domain